MIIARMIALAAVAAGHHEAITTSPGQPRHE
jgi:hypothetical protein